MDQSINSGYSRYTELNTFYEDGSKSHTFALCYVEWFQASLPHVVRGFICNKSIIAEWEQNNMDTRQMEIYNRIARDRRVNNDQHYFSWNRV